MKTITEEPETREQGPPVLRIPERAEVIASEKLDPKNLRVEHVGKLLDHAYQGAATLKLTRDEVKKLREDFPDDAVEIRPHDGIIYISHMALRERLWDVFGPGQVAEICRERSIRNDSNEIAVDLVLMVRGVWVSEGIGTSKYFPNNPKGSFGDTIEAAWSDALRRCCKKFGVGVQVWRPAFVREWLERCATELNGRWVRKDKVKSERPLKFVRASRPKAPAASTADPAVESERWSEPIEAHRKTAEKEQDEEAPF